MEKLPTEILEAIIQETGRLAVEAQWNLARTCRRIYQTALPALFIVRTLRYSIDGTRKDNRSSMTVEVGKFVRFLELVVIYDRNYPTENLDYKLSSVVVKDLADFPNLIGLKITMKIKNSFHPSIEVPRILDHILQSHLNLKHLSIQMKMALTYSRAPLPAVEGVEIPLEEIHKLACGTTTQQAVAQLKTLDMDIPIALLKIEVFIVGIIQALARSIGTVERLTVHDWDRSLFFHSRVFPDRLAKVKKDDDTEDENSGSDEVRVFELPSLRVLDATSGPVFKYMIYRFKFDYERFQLLVVDYRHNHLYSQFQSIAMNQYGDMLANLQVLDSSGLKILPNELWLPHEHPNHPPPSLATSFTTVRGKSITPKLLKRDISDSNGEPRMDGLRKVESEEYLELTPAQMELLVVEGRYEGIIGSFGSSYPATE